MALNDIRISLQLLAESVEDLEKQIEEKEKAAKTPSSKKAPPQIDMFGGWSPKPSNDKNNALLAKKLDSTIDRIQNLLKEGVG